ncbi:MAG: hypothetical protein OXS29_08890 [bacterium]|nr:hypothetical protein [bacterium]MDE0287587.1 hypothetical protein [bacterium]MDE0440239.1 hypothetical protein [bacterium]
MPVIRLADVPEVAQIGPGLDTIIMKKVIGSTERDPAFQMPDETPSLSITHVKIWGHLGRSSNDETDRAMFIVDGDGVARVGEDPAQGFGAGDFLLIPKGVPYECDGNFTYLVINSPAYRQGTDVADLA